MLETTVDILTSGLDNIMMLGYQKNIQHVVEKISHNKDINHVRIFNIDGMILYASDSSEVGKNMSVVAPEHVELNFDSLKTRKIFRIPGEHLFKITEPILNKESCQKCHESEKYLGYLDIDTDFTKAETNFYTGSIHIIFLGIAVIIILTFGFYFMYNHFINRPLQRFVKAIENVETGNLSAKLSVSKKDEFGVLENHFNRMVSHLKSSQERIEELHFEQLQRADKLVTLGELTSEIAHEINNHAAIIMSRTDYLKLQSIEDESIQHYNEDLDVIINQINKVSKITRNILKHGKKQSQNFQEFDIVKVVDESLLMLEPILQKRNITFLKYFEMEEALIYGDPLQIDQLLTNLAINALDAIEKDGELKIAIKINENNNPQIIVADNGNGISHQNLEQIYSPFFTTKSLGKGTGLGLYIVKNICNNHNAEIKCDSKIGEGTVFTITFINNKK